MKKKNGISGVDKIILIYILLFTINSSWQLAFNIINITEFVTSVVIYIMPISFLICADTILKNITIEFFLKLVISISCIVSLFALVDTYFMTLNGVVSNYSLKAIEYSQSRTNTDELTTNFARVTSGGRSHGILEKHSVTAAWIAFGGIAALAMPWKKYKYLKTVGIIITLSILLVFQNITSLFAFCMVLVILEFQLHRIVTKGKISIKNTIKIFKIVAFAVLTPLVILIALSGYELNIKDKYTNLMLAQWDIITGTTKIENVSYFMDFLSRIIYYPINSMNYPFSILIGEGFTSYGIPKASDYGFVETLHTFGLPGTIILLYGFTKMVLKYLNINVSDTPNTRCNHEGKFAVGILLYILFNEIHYSIWNAKSILPVMFLALGLLNKYLREEHFRKRAYD